MSERIFAYVPHGLREAAFRLGWLWRARLPGSHGVWSDLWEWRCCCGRAPVHPRRRPS